MLFSFERVHTIDSEYTDIKPAMVVLGQKKGYIKIQGVIERICGVMCLSRVNWNNLDLGRS